MLPTLKPGQEILVSSLPYLFFRPKPEDLIAFKSGGKFVVKRLKKVAGDRFQVVGDNKQDSRDYGWIERKKILGKVIYIAA